MSEDYQDDQVDEVSDEDAPVEDISSDDVVPLEGIVVSPSDDVVLVQEDGTEINLSSPTLNADEARELTDNIRSTADMLYVLIARAHAGKAWSALGYDSFEGYVRAEFDMSRSRAYQLLNQSRIIEAIEAVVPEGTEVRLTEAAARDLKKQIGELVPEIEERTKDLDPESAAAALEDLIEEERRRMREDDADSLAYDTSGDSLPEELAGDQADRDGFSGSSSDDWDDDFDEDLDADDLDMTEIDSMLDEDVDRSKIRRRFEAVYNLYTSLSALDNMPPVDEVVDTIPPERRVQVTASLPRVVAWLEEFKKVWESQDWQPSASDEDSDDEAESEDNDLAEDSSLAVEEFEVADTDSVDEDLFKEFDDSETS